MSAVEGVAVRSGLTPGPGGSFLCGVLFKCVDTCSLRINESCSDVRIQEETVVKTEGREEGIGREEGGHCAKRSKASLVCT